jgi:hypothetical protein
MTTTSHPLLHRVPVLSVDESVRVADAVHALRPLWRQRHETQPFFTLGTAAYMDARDGAFAGYQAKLAESNAMLREHFGWLLDRFRERVSEQVGAEMVYDPRLALPGFHVFLFDEAFRKSGASVHYDKQFEHIDWTQFGVPDTDAQLSLTLSIKLPAGGGGLLVWNINRIEIERMPPEQRLEHSRAHRNATFEPYEVGTLAIHSGHQLHQIGPAPHLQPGDERITLQAHALPVDGRWILYW